MAQKRPVYLNLMQIRLPLPGLVSILHRISGVLLFLFIPVLIYLLSESLRSSDAFNDIRQVFAHPVAKFFVWLILSSLAYHLIAGIRHLLMDTGIGETLKGGRLGAYFVIFLSIIGSLLLGIWLW